MRDSQIDIKSLLPHRDPILLVDQVVNLSSTEVTSSFLVTKNSLFLDNENNAFSEEGFIENMAQTASIIIGQSYISPGAVNNSEVIGFISTVKSFNLLGEHVPSLSKISTWAKVTSRVDGEDYTICTVDCKTTYNDKVVANGILNLFIKVN